MFDIKEFYKVAEEGGRVDIDEFREYWEKFTSVIIWGAGNLGTALGKGFLSNKLQFDLYWDKNYTDKVECNGVKVGEPFSGDFDPERTLVIIGIVNGTLSHRWQENELEKNGFHNYLLGMQVYEALFCPQEINKPYNAKYCVDTSICNFNTCKRYMSVLKNGKENTGLSVQVLDINVSARCTLDCKYCGQQAGDTKRKFPEKYIDYPIEDTIRSIDLIVDRMDAVGTFSIIGGEPFIHPQIKHIIVHCLTKNNVGMIAITTNGICKLTDDLLDSIRDDRVKINFSNYTKELSEREKKLFNDNVEKVRNAGIACNISTPIWSINTDELCDNPDFSDEKLDWRRSVCVMGPSIAGNIFYVCPQTERMDRMEVHDVTEDMIDLSGDIEDLTERMRKMLNRSHYTACYLCANMKPTGGQIPPGQQYKDFE